MGGVMLRRSFFSWKKSFLLEEVFFPSDHDHNCRSGIKLFHVIKNTRLCRGIFAYISWNNFVAPSRPRWSLEQMVNGIKLFHERPPIPWLTALMILITFYTFFASAGE
jgi:hypothetical protein